MKRLKSLLSAALVALLSAAFILPLAACGEGTDGDNAVYVTSKGGMALQNVTVELLKDGSSISAKNTDEKGKVSYNLKSNTEYEVKLSNVPVGFLPEDSYKVKGSDKTTYIRLDSKVIETGTPKNYYKTGDVMYDFEQTYYTYNSTTNKIDTRTAKLSDFFAEGKKAVLLNFWYAGCGPCMAEIPCISSAYEKYSDKIEVLGINDYATESLTHVTNLVQAQKIPYLMCKDNGAVGVWFQKAGWPLSVMIDRYGIVCQTLAGTETEQTFWDDWFEKYTSDKYEQEVERGEDPDPVLIPDRPGDFNVSMPASSEINKNTSINNTGRNVIFSAFEGNSSYGWPWDLTSDGTAICPTNSGHQGTMAVIYAQINLKANEVLAFDYKLSNMNGSDYFYVSLDSRGGTGRQISMTSGVQDWQTGYSYAAIEDGTHEIEFSYYRSTSNSSQDDKVYINNLRIITVNQMNAALVEKEASFEIPYFATRSYNNKSKQFEVIEDVYLADDGYYHIGTKDDGSERGNDPYLLLDVSHSTPYFGTNSESLYTLMNAKIESDGGGMYINNEDYTDIFRSYLSISNNSAYNGLIPVNKDIKDTITKLYKDEIPEGAKYYSEKGWLQFCVYYKQYGVQKDISDPVKGLAYFSAFEAKETVGADNYVKVEKGKGQFVFDENSGRYVDVEGTDKAKDADYVLNPTINKVHFETIIMPRGYMYKFVPTKSGVYSINGIDCYYYNADESVVDGEETDAVLYDGSLEVSHAYGGNYILAVSDSDRYERNDVPDSFKIIHYLEAGKTYYINVAFRVVETTGDFAFRIDYLDEEYSYISQASANVYTLDENNKMVLPLYCEPYYDADKDEWLDRKGCGTIFVDFTQKSAMFDNYTIEQVINEDFKSSQFTFDISQETYTYTDQETGKKVTIDISLDLIARYKKEENIPDILKEVLKDYPIANYTERMQYYLDKSKEGKQVTDPEYGLVPVNNELYCILQLYNAKFFGYDTPDEWLKACCFRMNVNENNHG